MIGNRCKSAEETKTCLSLCDVKMVTHIGDRESDIFEEFSKPITPHPHAEIIMKYAEVAQRRVDPWVEFEARLTNDHRNTWFKIPDGKFFNLATDFEYRHIGETK
jgi:hypothetical protein